jgi:hypothetical protein
MATGLPADVLAGATALPAIQPLCGLNLPGLLGCLRVIPASNVLHVPLVMGSVHQGELVLRDPLNYADLWFQAGSGQFEESEDDDEQGPLYKQKLTIVTPRDEPDVAVAIAAYRAHRYFVALYQDGNGYTKLVGSPEWPLRFEAALSTGQRPGDRNGHTIVFAVNSPTPAYFYQHFPAPPAGNRRVFSAGFTFGFQRTP